jgi:anti-sigma regulatory factor (Ser/Thr protein kinase)
MTPNHSSHGFSHEVLFHTGLDEFTDSATQFIGQGLELDEPVMVMVGSAKVQVLREALGADAARIRLVDMEVVGRNPARIIPAWAGFFARHGSASRPARGIGEPIWASRSAAELAECQLHESLLNLAFADERGRLLCPYDVEALDPQVIEEARRGHPLIADQPAEVRVNPACDDRPWLDHRFVEALPEPRAPAEKLAFDSGNLGAVRALVARTASTLGLAAQRVDDFALAAHELAANSIRHAGGSGVLRLWQDPHSLICEVSDGGHIADPLVGRSYPSVDVEGGRGLWMANHLADLSQIRSGPSGTVVRIHLGLST